MIYINGNLEDDDVHHLVVRGRVYHARVMNSRIICLEDKDLVGAGMTLESQFRDLTNKIETKYA